MAKISNCCINCLQLMWVQLKRNYETRKNFVTRYPQEYANYSAYCFVGKITDYYVALRVQYANGLVVSGDPTSIS